MTFIASRFPSATESSARIPRPREATCAATARAVEPHDSVQLTGGTASALRHDPPPPPPPNGPPIIDDDPPSQNWTLVWSDEFDQPNGSSPDPAHWNLEQGGDGWGNHELETYTNRPRNASIHKGNLVITARKEHYTGPDGIRRNYTSARLTTEKLFEQPYGRFEARIKLPSGKGMWPAFWLLGNNSDQVGWPACGEIDIMENVGNMPSTNYGTVHGPGYSGAHGISASYTLPNGQKLSDDFHVYAVEWDPQSVKFFLDDHHYQTVTRSSLPSGAKWVFDHPFFLIMNVAVGGDWPGPPSFKTHFPQRMWVDYVRVYKPSDGGPGRPPAVTPGAL